MARSLIAVANHHVSRCITRQLGIEMSEGDINQDDAGGWHRMGAYAWNQGPLVLHRSFPVAQWCPFLFFLVRAPL